MAKRDYQVDIDEMNKLISYWEYIKKHHHKKLADCNDLIEKLNKDLEGYKKKLEQTEIEAD